MDGIVIIVLLIIACVYFRNFSKVVYSIAIVDLFLRIFNYLITNVKIEGITEYLIKYLPSSMPNLIEKYTSGLFANVLIWAYVIVMAIFLFYTVRVFFKKK